MSKSNARKRREKFVREGKRSPSENRGVYVLTDMRTRKTKTKKELMTQVKHKGRLSYEDKSTFFVSKVEKDRDGTCIFEFNKYISYT